MSNTVDLQYPIGKFTPKADYSPSDILSNIAELERLPVTLETLALGLTPKQLDMPYREGGWTARQVIHHVADSHMNAYIRTKWALTEDSPTIKAYDEKAWATTPENKLDPSLSILLIKTLHTKWTALLRELQPEDFSRSFVHPETHKHVRLDRNIALYAWHGQHHCGHLKIVAGMR